MCDDRIAHRAGCELATIRLQASALTEAAVRDGLTLRACLVEVLGAFTERRTRLNRRGYTQSRSSPGSH